MVRFPAVARFNFLDFPENFSNCFRLHRKKRRNPGCSLAVEYLYIYEVSQTKTKYPIITDEGLRRNVYQKCFSLSIYI